MPGWAGDRVELETAGGRVTVRLRPPALLAPLSRALEVSSIGVDPPAGGEPMSALDLVDRAGRCARRDRLRRLGRGRDRRPG